MTDPALSTGNTYLELLESSSAPLRDSGGGDRTERKKERESERWRERDRKNCNLNFIGQNEIYFPLLSGPPWLHEGVAYVCLEKICGSAGLRYSLGLEPTLGGA